MTLSNLLEALDVKKVIEHAAYFLLFTIAVSSLWYVLERISYLPPDLSPFPFVGNFISLQLLNSVLWGISSTIKAQYTSLKKAPLFLISGVFILSSSIYMTTSTESLQSRDTIQQKITHKTKKFVNEISWEKLSDIKKTISGWARFFMLLLLIPLMIVHIFPVWMMLKSGYILTKIYFSSS